MGTFAILADHVNQIVAAWTRWTYWRKDVTH
jgi:hypothetical protein